MKQQKKVFNTQDLIKIALLSSIAAILMQFGAIKLPGIFPSFLEIDFSEVPAIVAILTINPLAGLVVVVLKNILKGLLFGSTSSYVGELANMLIAIGYILPLMLMMKKERGIKAVSIGIVLGIFGMTVMGAFVNYFITLPFYAQVFMPMEAIVGMGTAVNPAIVDKLTFVIYAIIPFNILKGTLAAIVSVIFVKSLNPVLKYLRPKHYQR